MIGVLAFAFLASVSGKTYERCELAKELKYAYEVPDSEVGTWVCIAEHESLYNTSAVGMMNGDGSSDHGIFQISDKFWCSPPGKGWACGLTCAELEDDDIEDDFICARRIFKEHKVLSGNGFNAWAVYKPHCKGERARKYVEGCFNETDELPHPKKKVTTKKLYPWMVPRPSSTTPSSKPAGPNLPKCFLGGNDLGTASPQFSTISTSDDNAPLINVVAPTSESVANPPIISPFGNNIPVARGFFSPSSAKASTSPIAFRPQFGGLEPISRYVSTPPTPVSRFGSSLLSTETASKSAVPSAFSFPIIATTESARASNRFLSQTPKATFAAPTETSTSDQGILSRTNQKPKSTFIINGKAWL